MEINKFYLGRWEDLTSAIPDESADLVLTDPPYNISNETKIFRDYRKNDGLNGSVRSKRKGGDVSFNFGSWDYTFQPEPFLEEAKRILKPGGSLIVWTSDQLFGTYQTWAREDQVMVIKSPLAWIKTNPMPQFRLTNYRYALEFMIWLAKGQPSADQFIFGKQEDMVNYFVAPLCSGNERLKEVRDGGSRAVHPCQKPLRIHEALVSRHCPKGGLVVDFFGGVGTTAMAAYKHGRQFISIEALEKYHDAAEKRFRQYQAQVEENTDEFEQIKLF